MGMKKYIRYFFLLVMIFAGLCGCGRKKGPERNEKEQLIEKDVVYETGEVDTFCIDEKGMLYTYEPETSAICVYDADGKKIKEIAVEAADYKNICVGNGILYAGYCEKEQPIGLFMSEISLEDGSRTVFYQDNIGHSVSGMEFIGQKLYFMTLSVMDSQEQYEKNDPDGGFDFYGEKMLCYDPNEKKVNELSVDRIRHFCKKDENSLWVYAYDPEIGEFYFSEVDSKTEMVGEKYYVGNSMDGFVPAIAYDNRLERILFPLQSSQMLVAVNPQSANEKNSFWSMPAGIYNGNDLKYQNERTYLLAGGKVTRIRNGQYIRSQVPLKVYSVTTEYTLPEGTGYTFDIENMSIDAITTAILAGDADYDLLLFSTDSPLAEQIRRTGAYEPLNQVEGVETYLNSSFDYIREAATAENGTIWMLPYEVDCNILVYQPEICRELGIDVEQSFSNEALLKARQVMSENSGTQKLYYKCNFFMEMRRIMEQYLADYAVVNGKADFRSELFRSHSELLMKYADSASGGIRNGGIHPLNELSFSLEMTDEDVKEIYTEYYERVALASVNKAELCRRYGGIIMEGKESTGEGYGLTTFDFLQIKPMPSLEPDKPQKSIAHATFLILNPNSKHLKEAKEYLTAFTDLLCTEESLSRTKTLSGTYTAAEHKAHEIYQNARIVFSYPEDVFWEEYGYYLKGEKTLDEVIPELERRLNAYLFE